MGGYGSGDKVGHPFYGNQHGKDRAEKKIGVPRGKPGAPGIKQWSGKVSHDFAKDVHFIRGTPKEIQEDIEWQLSELSEITGIKIEKVNTFSVNEKIRLHKAFGTTVPHQSIGIATHATNKWVQENATIATPEDVEKMKAWSQEARAKGDFTKVAEYDGKIQRAEKYGSGYKTIVFAGEGPNERNAAVDHEFFHYMAAERLYKGLGGMAPTPGQRLGYGSNPTKQYMENLADKCRSFCKAKGFSYYGATSLSRAEISYEEASAETYSYWKSGNDVPKEIEEMFKVIEKGDYL